MSKHDRNCERIMNVNANVNANVNMNAKSVFQIFVGNVPATLSTDTLRITKMNRNKENQQPKPCRHGWILYRRAAPAASFSFRAPPYAPCLGITSVLVSGLGRVVSLVTYSVVAFARAMCSVVVAGAEPRRTHTTGTQTKKRWI